MFGRRWANLPKVFCAERPPTHLSFPHAIVNAGAVPLLVKLLTPERVPEIHEAAAGVLRNLACSDENEEAILKEGTVMPLVALLGSESAEAQLLSTHRPDSGSARA